MDPSSRMSVSSSSSHLWILLWWCLGLFLLLSVLLSTPMVLADHPAWLAETRESNSPLVAPPSPQGWAWASSLTHPNVCCTPPGCVALFFFCNPQLSEEEIVQFRVSFLSYYSLNPWREGLVSHLSDIWCMQVGWTDDGGVKGWWPACSRSCVQEEEMVVLVRGGTVLHVFLPFCRHPRTRKWWSHHQRVQWE